MADKLNVPSIKDLECISGQDYSRAQGGGDCVSKKEGITFLTSVKATQLLRKNVKRCFAQRGGKYFCCPLTGLIDKKGQFVKGGTFQKQIAVRRGKTMFFHSFTKAEKFFIFCFDI